jgi:hypothetical protein
MPMLPTEGQHFFLFETAGYLISLEVVFMGSFRRLESEQMPKRPEL